MKLRLDKHKISISKQCLHVMETCSKFVYNWSLKITQISHKASIPIFIRNIHFRVLISHIIKLLVFDDMAVIKLFESYICYFAYVSNQLLIDIKGLKMKSTYAVIWHKVTTHASRVLKYRLYIMRKLWIKGLNSLFVNAV